ncbi:MAG: thioredoxin domain-containing protein [Chthoniobacterales bacterium]
MPNHLAAATSPYLLQHKDNPVHWHEWNEAAFARAKTENKPVFLSIGYSTCHWCHVMAHESFEIPEVAAVLNDFFVSIKVDREERPDIDRLYMAFVQATTGSGGWPMSVWLTPNAEPFFGGTYFPPTDRYGRPGFVTVLERIAEIWARERENVLAQGAQVIASLKESSTPAPVSELSSASLAAGLEAFSRSYDATHGGFGGGPKFPRPSVFDFLMRTKDPLGREMTLHSLRKMAAGGMRDHLGGGFHRYSVDGEWHVPHFEKMLYDQAQLVNSHLDAWLVSDDPTFAEIARDTLAYVSRCLTHPLGGFFSAEDADSLLEHGKPGHSEGAFYVWTKDEITSLLDADEAAIFCRHFGVEPGGNVLPQADPHGEFPGKNILIQREPTAETDREPLARARQILVTARESRPKPHLDDKVLAAWNGLMISAFARAGAILGDGAYLDAARRAMNFLREQMFNITTGELLRTWRDGKAGIRAFAEDYAFVIHALLDLYEATFDPEWLEWAITLQAKQDELFFDGNSYLGSPEGDPLVPVRMRDDYDGAEPSANSVSALNLLRLGWMRHDDDLVARARCVVSSFGGILNAMPSAVPKMLCALDMLLTPPRQWVIAGERADADTETLAHAVRRKFDPNRVLIFAGDTPSSTDMQPLNGRAALYRCENFACQAPVTDLRDDLARP